MRWHALHVNNELPRFPLPLSNLPPREELLSFKLAHDVTDLPLLSAMLQKIQRFGERWLRAFSVSPWVYPQKWVIHVSMAAGIIAPACGCICESRSMCLGEPPSLFACLEWTSFITIKAPQSSQQADSTDAVGREGMHTLSTLYSYLIALPLEKTHSTYAQMRATKFLLVSLFFALVVFSHHYFIILVSHKHFTSNSCVFFFCSVKYLLFYSPALFLWVASSISAPRRGFTGQY